MLKGGSRPWSQTMVSEGARPWGGGRSGDCEKSKKSKDWRVRDDGHANWGVAAVASEIASGAAPPALCNP